MIEISAYNSNINASYIRRILHELAKCKLTPLSIEISPAQVAAYEEIGLTVLSTVARLQDGKGDILKRTPMTMAGIPLEIVPDCPQDVIWFRDSNNVRIGAITSLAIPSGFYQTPSFYVDNVGPQYYERVEPVEPPLPRRRIKTK